MKENKKSFLFLNRIWFWLCAVPWFVLLYNGVQYGNMDALLAYLLGIVFWGVTLIQEALNAINRKGLKTAQIILSFLKCAAFLVCYLTLTHIQMRFEEWQGMTVFLILCGVSFLQCCLENIRISKR